jgi:hypothetical protein
MFGSASIYFSGIPAAALGSQDAQNGLSIENHKVVFGQSFGTAGDPAQLLDGREILLNSFGIELRQGVFGTGGNAGLGITLVSAIGGLFHCIHGIMDDPTGSIVFRASNGGVNVQLACTQYECTNDGSSIQVGAFGNSAAVPAYRKNTGGIIGQSAVNPDIVLLGGNGAGGAGVVHFASLPGGVETETHRFLLPVNAVLDFPNTLAQTSSDLTAAVTGARSGDAVLLGVPNAAVNANSSYTAWVSANDTVTIRFNNYSVAAINPASGTFKIAVVRLLP